MHLQFYFTRRFTEELRLEAERVEANRTPVVEPVDPKKELLDHVRKMMEANENSKPVNPINQCAEAAAAPI